MGVAHEQLEKSARSDQEWRGGSAPTDTQAPAPLTRAQLVAEIHAWLATRRRRA